MLILLSILLFISYLVHLLLIPFFSIVAFLSMIAIIVYLIIMIIKASRDKIKNPKSKQRFKLLVALFIVLLPFIVSFTLHILGINGMIVESESRPIKIFGLLCYFILMIYSIFIRTKETGEVVLDSSCKDLQDIQSDDYYQYNLVLEERRKTMKYIFISVQPKDAEKKLNQLATQGYKVVSQSESTWVISKCFGLSKSVDAIINFVLVKEGI